MKMLHFPIEIHRVILSYLQQQDGVEWCCCTKQWHHEILKRFYRRFRINMRTYCQAEDESKLDTLMEMIPRVICDPANQLEVFIPLSCTESFVSVEFKRLFRFFASINFSLYLISCDISFMNLLSQMPSQFQFYLRSIRLLCYSFQAKDVISNPKFSEALQRFVKLETMVFESTIITGVDLPYLSCIKSLHIKQVVSTIPILTSYYQQLHQLTLVNCGITDVRTLGSIPELTFENCHEINDISALTHNQKIKLYCCNGISECLQSFMNSRVIDLYLGRECLLDLSHCQSVQTLLLGGRIICPEGKRLQIPSTVRQCTLQDLDLNILDVDSLNHHPLRILSFIRVYQVKEVLSSLLLPYLTMLTLRELEIRTLEGLVRSNRLKKVEITSCLNLMDYSPVQKISEVIVRGKAHRHLAEFRQVRVLKLAVTELTIDFDQEYHLIQSLDLGKTKTIMVSNWQCLESIPIIVLHGRHLPILQQYLESGKQFSHQRIDVICEENVNWSELLQGLYDLWLQANYLLRRVRNHSLPQGMMRLVRK